MKKEISKKKEKKLLYKCSDTSLLKFMGKIPKIHFLLRGRVFRISAMDVHCTVGMGVRPKADGYGYGVGGIGIFYLFSGRHKWRTP